MPRALRAKVPSVRTLSLSVLGAALGLLAACSSVTPRTLPRQALIARAWAGREPPTTERALEAVAFATAQIGKRYCWGGTGPACFDCSGLAQVAWRRAGARIPRTTHEMASTLVEVPVDEVRAGDILWWPGHVGLYAGNGWLVDALDSRHGVVRRPALDPYRAFRPTPSEPGVTRADAARGEAAYGGGFEAMAAVPAGPR